MNIVTNLSTWQAIRRELGAVDIGFVPTMGHLHPGHISLCQRAKTENALTVVSIFVNPAQFNNQCDFSNYPRTIEDDICLLNENNIDYLLLPEAEAMYPDQYEVQLNETTLSHALEGACRPGHFQGMLTVVLKLINLVQPTRAYFGEKDYQQLMLIKKMAEALFLPVQIIGCPTLRAEDGLAFSSRNSRLTAAQREIASHFPRLLQSTLSTDAIGEQLTTLGFKVDYIAECWQRRLGAVWLDGVRLIDNIALNP